MRKLSVEVLETASHPEGGYAVVLLHGIETLPDGATFRIKPVDAKGRGDEGLSASWPTGEHRPRAVRRTDAGIELLIGPDIVESPALIPGTIGVIEIQAAGVRGEFLWPSIRPTARPRRRHLTVVKPQAEAKQALQVTVPAKPGIAPGDLPIVSVVTSSLGQAPAGNARGSAGGSEARGEHDTARPEIAAPLVTAHDHVTPATASIEQAMGGKVVQLELQREKSQQPVGGDRDGISPREGGSAERDAQRHSLSGWTNTHVRMAALAATFVVIVSGATLLLGHRQDTGATARMKGETVKAAPQRQSGAIAAVDPSPASRPLSTPPEPAAPSAAAAPAEPAAADMSRTDAASKEAPDAAPQSAAVVNPATVTSTAATGGQEVTLRMRGGGFQITGELRGFDGAKYVIESRVAGVLTMDASRFECIGEACGRPAAAILTLSERPSPAKPDVYRIEGSAALAAEFIPQLLRDYAASIGAAVREVPREQGEGVRYRIADQRGAELATIEVHNSATSSALAAVDRGAAVIGLIDRPLEAEPASRIRGRPVARGRQPAPAQPVDLVVGLDGIAAVAAADNPLASISIDNLAKVLAGQITDWYDLGMAPGPIQLYLPPDGMGTMDAALRQILRPRGLDAARSARRLGSDAEASDAAARDPRGLALVSLASQRGAKAINLQSACGLIVRPAPFGIKTGEYPLIRRLSLQMPANVQQPSARGLLRLAQSNDVNAAMAAARLVDQSVVTLPIEEQSERMAWAVNAPASSFDMNELRQMLGDLDGAVRLSLTFRFVAGTNEIHPTSKADVARLAGLMREAPLAGQRIILAGFTDAGGKFQANLTVSQRRAGQIRAALVSAAGAAVDPRQVVAKGYGSLAPVACNGTPEGQRLNRRVEVWVAGGGAARSNAR